jgi:hypothetical protein
VLRGRRWLRREEFAAAIVHEVQSGTYGDPGPVLADVTVPAQSGRVIRTIVAEGPINTPRSRWPRGTELVLEFRLVCAVQRWVWPVIDGRRLLGAYDAKWRAGQT